MGQTQRPRSLRGIQRMARLAAGGQPQGQQRQILLEQDRQNRLIAAPPLPAIPPAEPDRRARRVRQVSQAPPQPGIGLRTDGIGTAPQHGRTGGDA